MSSWDPALYLAHRGERARPFLDLLARVPLGPDEVLRAVDLGCGPGHLMPALRDRWPGADLRGVDSSPEMIEQAVAQNEDPSAGFERADVATWAPPRPVDLLVSNALFQWVPDQRAVIERLAGHVRPGGVMALPVPDNYAGPSHVLLHEISSRPPYAEHTAGLHEDRGTGAEAYLELFSGLGWSVDAWTTTYLHVLPGEDPVLSWISGTGARPILQALPDGLRADFEAEYRAALREAYPRRPWGTVLPFQRVFAVATRPGDADR